MRGPEDGFKNGAALAEEEATTRVASHKTADDAPHAVYSKAERLHEEGVSVRSYAQARESESRVCEAVAEREHDEDEAVGPPHEARARCAVSMRCPKHREQTQEVE